MWYTKTKLVKGNVCRCPNCESPFPFGPIFDHHGSECPSCKQGLVELQINGELLLIDTEKAPNIILEMLSYLRKLNEMDAFDELMVLMEFMGVEIKSKF